MNDVVFLLDPVRLNDARAIASKITIAALRQVGLRAGGTYTQEEVAQAKVIVVSAPIPEQSLLKLAWENPNSKVVLWNHTCWGVFGKEILDSTLQYVALARAAKNVVIGNVKPHVSEAFRTALNLTDKQFLWLPSVYRCPYVPQKRMLADVLASGVLRVGMVGAFSVVKNQFMSLLGAVLLAKDIGCKLSLVVGQSSENRVMGQSVEENILTFAEQSFIQVTRLPHAPWPYVRDLIADNVDIMMNCSYTEGLQLLTADGIAVGVPSVTSLAIPYDIKAWRAKSDDPFSIGDAGLRALEVSHMDEAHKNLTNYGDTALRCWLDLLEA